MEEFSGHGFDAFSVEMEDFEVRKTKKHDRMWKVEEGGSICQIILPHEGAVYFGSLNKVFYKISADRGRKIWQFKTEGIILESSPAIWDGKVYFGSYDHNMYCLDAETGEMVWKYRTNREINAAPVIHEGRVYFGSTDQYLYCLDAETGQMLWKFYTQDDVQSTPVVHEGKIFFGSFDRNFYCLDAEKGRLIWKVETQGEIYYFNQPLIHDGLIYFPSFDNLVRAVRIEDGIVMWKFKTGNYGCVCCPVLHDGRLYVTSRDGFLFCLTMSGKQVWKFARNEPMCLPTIYDRKIYFGCEDRNLYCLDLKGKVMWTFETQGVIWLKPVIYEGMVMIPSFDCHVYALKPDTGKLLWKFRTEGDPSPVPPPYDAFEVTMKRVIDTSKRVEEGRQKQYELDLEEEENTSTYKSRITYQVSTQYSEKGKYQVDSDEEEF
jgi:outer membrane protein assembly factor BamB